jgi:hypothetical protein
MTENTNGTVNFHGAKGPGAMTIPMPGAVARWQATTGVEIGVADALGNVLSTTTTNPDTRTTPNLAREITEDRHANPIGNIHQDDRTDMSSVLVRESDPATS